jgi:hypothetical protein
MALPWLAVQSDARERGLACVTADQVIQNGLDPKSVLLVAYDWTPDAAELLSHGARPAALVSFEPPVIAWELYYGLRRLSGRFPHTFLFGGARARVHPSSCFHALHFPEPRPPERPMATPWSTRGFLTMINSNKALPRAHDAARWLDRPREVSLKRLVAGLRYRPILKDCYVDRLRAIAAFAVAPDFDLYGEGWERRHPAVARELHAAACRTYRGAVEHKLHTLASYRFSLVIENNRFPGYITEKLLDCFLARCVPVYRGAPDVADYVPRSTFIDADRFGSWRELERFLRGVNASEWKCYLDAAERFLRSPAYAGFSATTFASELVDALLDVQTRYT